MAELIARIIMPITESVSDAVAKKAGYKFIGAIEDGPSQPGVLLNRWIIEN